MASPKTGALKLADAGDVHAAALAPHERILSVARELFCRDGIGATGIDRVLAEAGASKMTLYSRFGSKEALLQAVLREEGAERRAEIFAAVTAAGPDASTRLRGIMSALRGWHQSGRFYGCAFMNAVAERAKGPVAAGTWLHEITLQHEQEILDFVAGLADEAGFAEPDVLARQLALVLNGAISSLLVTRDDRVIGIADRNVAAVLAMAARRDP